MDANSSEVECHIKKKKERKDFSTEKLVIPYLILNYFINQEKVFLFSIYWLLIIIKMEAFI